jgi:hypothetical protein
MLTLLFFALIAWACSGTVASRTLPSSVLPAAVPGAGWWHARFQMSWPERQEPAWHRDAFLAHQVIAPVLADQAEASLPWRIHRRAARDSTGHQFSFIFFASPRKARSIFGQLKANALLKRLQAAGLVSRTVYEDPTEVSKARLEDTSDPQWSVYLRQSWPYYIAGVSRCWLNLVGRVAEAEAGGALPTSVSGLDDFYRRVDAAVSDIWLQEGQHAFLHHLNAVFGYKPLIVYERRQMNF